MHVMQIIAVQAESPQEAIGMVEYHLDARSGDWWDYYTVGGRWNGHFAAYTPGAASGGNVLSLVHHRDAFTTVLREVAVEQNETYLCHRDAAFGYPVAYVPDGGVEGADLWHVVGAAASSDEVLAARLTVKNAQSGAEVRSLFAALSLSEARQALNGFSPGVYALERMVALAEGDWTPDSGFLDAEGWDTNVSQYLERHGSKTYGEDGESPHLVVVDFHY